MRDWKGPSARICRSLLPHTTEEFLSSQVLAHIWAPIEMRVAWGQGKKGLSRID
jgi:hypothetical protein